MIGRRQDLLNQQPCRNRRQETLRQERHFDWRMTFRLCTQRAAPTPSTARKVRENQNHFAIDSSRQIISRWALDMPLRSRGAG
jgi:hypothetical protein